MSVRVYLLAQRAFGAARTGSVFAFAPFIGAALAVMLGDRAFSGLMLLGSTVELGPGTLAQLHLGLSINKLTLPSDLIGPGLLQGDILTAPLRYDHGRLSPPIAPGLGIQIDRDLLEKYADSTA